VHLPVVAPYLENWFDLDTTLVIFTTDTITLMSKVRPPVKKSSFKGLPVLGWMEWFGGWLEWFSGWLEWFSGWWL